MRASVTADLDIELSVADGRRAHLHLSGRGRRLELRVDDPSLFAGRQDTSMIAALAEVLSRQQLVVTVVHGSERLVSLGAVSAPWWQRRLTGGRRVRLGSWRGALTAARARLRGGAAVLPDVALAPPLTPWPPAPTFDSRRRRVPTTTHDPSRGGSARLLLFQHDPMLTDRRIVYRLGEETTIGSDPSCDVVLPGLEPHHTTITHDEADEYVVRTVEGPATVHGQRADGKALRTGARLGIGEHQLVFSREEFADHGRPYGGREGGERGIQRNQPARERGPRGPGDAL